MKKHLLIPTMFLAACATTGTGSKGSSAPFQGQAAVEKRRTEILDASKGAMDCMKVKQGEEPGKGGVFAVSADAAGKLTATPIKWDGPDKMKQCVVDKAAATPISPLPGPSVGALWEFLPPGSKPPHQDVPKDLEEKMQSLQATAQSEVEACAQQNLPPDFSADTEVSFFTYKDGTVYAPTVVKSTSKDGGYDSCVQNVVAKTKLPAVNVDDPIQLTFRFHVGRLEKL